MSRWEGLSPDVAGVILVGAEGCAETANEKWLRNPTAEEMDGFKDYCRSLHDNSGDKGPFDFTDWTVDGMGRPYWLKTVLVTPDTPKVAIEKARKFTRTLRIHVNF
jgi:hypothetical protein